MESLISIQNITKEYKAAKPIRALDNINLEISDGEFISIVGPSGAGKSTLNKLLVLEEYPSQGKIIVAERDLSRLRSREIPYYRRKVGVVFQDFKLLPQKNVWENIAFALEVCDIPSKEIAQKVSTVLELVGLQNRHLNYPQELSGGEKQRVSIARALIHSPRILIADEPTGNLDPVTAWEIIDLLTRINDSGTVVILATHNQDIVNRLTKRVISMKDGKIISDEKHGRYVI